MPSVELTRLRDQIFRILTYIDRPDEFRRALVNMLEQYGEHAYRAGEAVSSRPLLPAFRAPALVMRQLELELSAAAHRQPDLLLACAGALWQEAHMEPRLLAATILGQIPATHAEPVLASLHAWMRPAEDRQALDALLERGTVTLRRAAPDGLFRLIQMGLGTPGPENQRLALLLIEVIVSDPQFANLPPIFRLISPLLSAPPARLINDLHHSLAALARRTPAETAYFLRQTLATSSDPATARLVRRMVSEFPPEMQSSLRTALRSRSVI